jgi:hypothetical protein
VGLGGRGWADGYSWLEGFRGNYIDSWEKGLGFIPRQRDSECEGVDHLIYLYLKFDANPGPRASPRNNLVPMRLFDYLLGVRHENISMNKTSREPNAPDACDYHDTVNTPPRSLTSASSSYGVISSSEAVPCICAAKRERCRK